MDAIGILDEKTSWLMYPSELTPWSSYLYLYYETVKAFIPIFILCFASLFSLQVKFFVTILM